ncbi:MAG: ATP-binding protein [Nitrospirae bacterium]|nr:ATP-binding protein [Nitrospirota bacterium]MBF0591756.1 ATP-binding protein [Nitrospirota bacterium]
MNPFLNTTYIKTPDKFFGREREIQEIVKILKSNVPCSVIGPRRIGKSSLLYYLKIKDLGLGNYTPVYIDCMDVRKNPKVFLQRICNGLSSETCPDDLDALFDRLDGYLKDKKLLLLLDEIEDIAIKEFGVIFNWLRSKASSEALNIVTASKQEISKVFKVDDDVGSAFYNIFNSITLGVMQEAEVRTMLKTLAAPEFEAKCGTRIIEEVGTHPFLVQQLAARCYDKWEANEPFNDDTWVRILDRPESRITENGRRILEYLSKYGEAKKPRIAVTLRLVASEMQEAIIKLQRDSLVELKSTERDRVSVFGITEKGRKVAETF